jgi:23S rRNA pseudouridine955/2504/2580 synthase
MVLAKGRDWIMLDKPPGWLLQGGTKPFSTLTACLTAWPTIMVSVPSWSIGLDKDTSGVLLVARSARAAHSARPSRAVRHKVYWAIIAGVPSLEEGLIDAPLAKRPGRGEKMHVDEESGLPAGTRYRLVDRAGNRAAWVELQPLTAAAPQLRAHMAAIGHPIVGDAKYGGPTRS